MHPSYFPYGQSFHAQTRMNDDIRHIKVVGEGFVTASPDKISIIVGVRTENVDVQQALKENALVSNQMIDGFTQLGLTQEQIETSSFTITPKYDYSDGKSILVGYEIQHLFEITVQDVKQAGEVYSSAITNGANIAQDIRFHVTNPQSYENEALAAALLNAQEKANTIAKTLAITLAPTPSLVQEVSAERAEPYVTSAKMLAAPSPPIQPQSLTILATVHVTYQY
ncbi:DUF541 domain-containing protein [Priestia megaterium]|nr:DUF541 domain-containing protein [Priestia megaterium]